MSKQGSKSKQEDIATMSKCYLCGSDNSRIIHKGVRDNPGINVLKCDDCGLVRLDTFISDTDEYYRNADMRANDPETNLTEIRSTADVDDERRYHFIKRMIENRNYLDFGCGAGGYFHAQKTRQKPLMALS